MRIAIIGAGFTGLTAAYRLAKKGQDVTVFEKSHFAGGLAGGIREKDWQWTLESFYHHLFTSDNFALSLIRELGLEKQLQILRPKTSIFYQGKIEQFDSPLTLLKFPFLSFPQKVRTGLVTLFLKTTNDWRGLEKETAYEWLKKYYGEKSFKILWEPLITAKFGSFAKQISIAWFWARIKKRTTQLAYPEGGFQALADKLVEQIKKYHGKVYFGKEIKTLAELKGFDKIIITTPNFTFLRLAPQLPMSYQSQLQQQPMLGAINLILTLKESFLKDDTYWLNVNEKDFPFVAVVEHTNFIDKKYYGNNHILYVGGYYPSVHQYFKLSQDQLLQGFLPYLSKINPTFNFKFQILNFKLSASAYAQPVVPINYSQSILPYQTPIPNVYLANMQQVYPWDRGTNYAIEEGEKIAKIILL